MNYFLKPPDKSKIDIIFLVLVAFAIIMLSTPLFFIKPSLGDFYILIVGIAFLISRVLSLIHKNTDGLYENGIVFNDELIVWSHVVSWSLANENDLSFRIKDTTDLIEFATVTNMDLIEALLKRSVEIDSETNGRSNSAVAKIGDQ